MEERRARSLMVVFVVLGMAVGQSTASFRECYAGCFLTCMIIPGHSPISCGVKCLKHCIIPSSLTTSTAKEQTHYFCNFGCASSLCTNFSTKQDPGEENVAKCVDSCSTRCSKNFSP